MKPLFSKCCLVFRERKKTSAFHDATTQIAEKIVDLLQVDLTSFLASGARFLGREAASDEVAKSAKNFFESLENQWL